MCLHDGDNHWVIAPRVCKDVALPEILNFLYPPLKEFVNLLYISGAGPYIYYLKAIGSISRSNTINLKKMVESRA